MKVFICMVLLVSAVAVFAQRPITGAFGIKLGAPPPKEIEIMRNGNKFGSLFNPSMKFRDFAPYLLYVTPKTKKVYWLLTSQEFKTWEDAITEMNIVKNIFEKSYKMKFIQSRDTPLEKTYVLKNGNRFIILGVSKQILKSRVDLQYGDQTLDEVAEKELQNIEMQKTDDSMI